MFRHLLSLSAATAFLFAPSQAAQCNPRAISLPFKNQRLGGQASMRGVSLGIGTPEQELSFILCAEHTNTYAYGADGFCRNKDNGCLVGHGGRYNESSSTSATDASPPVKPFVDKAIDANWTRDSVVLGDGSSLQGFEFGVPANQTHNFRPQAEIGAAVNSTLINALHAAGNISSNSYALFWGDEFADEPRDGSVTFGGYDASIIGDSQNMTKAFTRSEPNNCPEGMIVQLTGMKLVNQDGTEVDILDGLGTLTACVVPSMRSIMAIPREYGGKLIENMGGKRSDDGKNTVGKDNARLLPLTPLLAPDSATFKGYLSVTVEKAIIVNFTDDQMLLKADPYIDSNGVTQFNASQADLAVISMLPGTQEMPRLGGMFFSSAYLIVNHDKNEFSIAAAQKQGAEAAVAGIDTANGCVAYLNGSTLRTSSSDAVNSTGATLSAGAIAGIAVGVVAGVVLLAGIAFFLWRRKRGVASPELPGDAPTKRPYAIEKEHSEVHEAPAHGGTVKTSPGERNYAVELDGRACPAELPVRQ